PSPPHSSTTHRCKPNRPTSFLDASAQQANSAHSLAASQFVTPQHTTGHAKSSHSTSGRHITSQRLTTLHSSATQHATTRHFTSRVHNKARRDISQLGDTSKQCSACHFLPARHPKSGHLWEARQRTTFQSDTRRHVSSSHSTPPLDSIS